MLNLTKTNTLSAVALAIAAIATPSLAAANTYGHSAYENCKRSDTESQVLGGVLGAVAGGVFGSQVAGNGARTEGSVLGAVLGGAAGSQIANKDCRPLAQAHRSEGGYTSSAPVYSSNSYNSGSYSSGSHSSTIHSPAVHTTTTYGSSAPVYSSAPAYSQPRVYSTSPVYQSAPVYSTAPVYGAPRYGNTVYTSPRVQTVNHSGSRPVYRSGNSLRHRGFDQRASLDREIRDTRLKLNDLRQRNRYERSHRLDRRIDRVGERLRALKNERKYVRSNRGGY